MEPRIFLLKGLTVSLMVPGLHHALCTQLRYYLMSGRGRKWCSDPCLQLRQSRLDLNSQDVGTTSVSILDNSRPPNPLHEILYHHYLREHLKVRKGLRNYNVQPRCVGKDNYRVFVKFNVSSSFKKRRGEQEQWVNFSTPTKSSSGKTTWHQKDYNEIASIHAKLASELQLLGRTFCPQFFLTGFTVA